MSGNKEIQTYFGRCRCCLSFGYLKNMWTEHDCEGEVEIYGEMLAHCFALAFEQSKDAGEEDQICESCVERLRDANNFKKQVLEAQDTLVNQMEEDEPLIKIEEDEHKEIVIIEPDELEVQIEDTEHFLDDSDQNEDPIEYEDCVFLEENLDSEEETEEKVKVTPETITEPNTSSNTDPEIPKKKPKWPKKLPRNERLKTYKQYTTESLRQCLEAVSSEEMTRFEASAVYNIPIKTITAKMRQLRVPGTQIEDPDKEKTYNFIQEIKSILTYTNATPYKSKINRFYCAYCYLEGPMFEDPKELRIHTRTQHVNDRINEIEFAMRPYWMYEILKVDIDNLLCNVCCVRIESWNDMFQHLKDKHDVVFEQAYKRVIPYTLTYGLLEPMNCALCAKQFSNFMQLDSHMNAHYDNYICCDCGDTYISAYRLKQHVKIHDTGKFMCKHCPKVFALEKYRKKHEELVHDHLAIFKCVYCNERFEKEYWRHLHVLDKHFEKTTVYTCEDCGKTFTWRPYYLGHRRKVHNSRDQTNADGSIKKNKRKKYTGERYLCTICSKTYQSKAGLKAHAKKYHKNTVKTKS